MLKGSRLPTREAERRHLAVTTAIEQLRAQRQALLDALSTVDDDSELAHDLRERLNDVLGRLRVLGREVRG